MRCLCPRCFTVVMSCLLVEKYAFATVISFVLPMCILISCSSVLCVLMALGMFMFVKVMSSLISVMSPSLFVLSFCAYGDVVGYL